MIPAHPRGITRPCALLQQAARMNHDDSFEGPILGYIALAIALAMMLAA